MEVYYTCSWENHRNLWENMGKHHGKWRFSSLGQWSNKKAKNPWPVSEVACPTLSSSPELRSPTSRSSRVFMASSCLGSRPGQISPCQILNCWFANLSSFLLGNLPTVGTSNLPVLLVSPCTSAMDPPLNDGGKSLEERMMAFGRWNQRYHMATLSDLVYK